VTFDQLGASSGFAPSPGSTSSIGDADPCNETLNSYEQAAERYRDADSPPHDAHLRFIDRLASALPGATVLEVGSGTGRDARLLEERGLRVSRSDAARSFVKMLRDDGYQARRLDVRYDDLEGPWDAVFANAVLLHLSRPDLIAVVARIRRALRPGGVVAFSVKEGDGEAWSEAKLGLPRYFTYWREGPLRDCLHSTGWVDVDVRHVRSHEPWLYVWGRRPSSDAAPGI
jgi:SAM-dependent methyltransferase